MKKAPLVLLATWLVVASGGVVQMLSSRADLAQPPHASEFDDFGGATGLACKNKTGHFTLTKIGDRWWFCTPSGHAFISMSVGNLVPAGRGQVDCNHQSAYDLLLHKYGDVTFNWAWQTLRRMTAWGFNSVGQDSGAQVLPEQRCSNCPWPGGRQPVPLPYIWEVKPAEYASVNRFDLASGPVKDIINGTNSHYTTWRGGALSDVYDPNLHQWWQAFLKSGRGGAQPLRANSPWVLGVFTDDSDYFWGSGAGPDFTVGHTNANPAWTTLISSPVQTYTQATPFGGLKEIYTDSLVYAKGGTANPSTPCSISSPCSLRDYLWQRYRGDIGALNKAWGSNYTTFDSTGKQIKNESVGTGDGTNTTFKHTLQHTPVSPFSILVLVSGKAKAGDCPWFHNYNCKSGLLPLARDTATLGSPDPNYLNQSDSTINYSDGEIVVTFVTPPPRGTTVTVDYIYGGWMAGGTGLMDEDGSNAKWVGTNPFCLEGADPNFPKYFSCVGGAAPHNPVPSANPMLGADLDNWVPQFAARFFKTMRDDLRTVSQVPYLGLDTIGSWDTPAYSKFLEGAGPYLDAAFVNLRANLPPPSPASFQEAYQYTTRYLGDVPLLMFSGQVAQADSAMSCHPNPNIGDLGTQQSRCQTWYYTVSYLLKTPSYNHDYPFVGFDWWGWQDFQDLNQGLVSIHDNAYDGKEAVIARGKDAWGYPTGGEAANYGDCIDSVKQANAIWRRLIP